MAQAQLRMKLQMAYKCTNAGQLEQAEVLIQQVLAHDPSHFDAASALAELYTRQEKFGAAVEILDRARDENPESSDTLARFATIYKNLGHFDRAKACYRRAIALDPARAARFHMALATTCRISAYDEDVRLMETAHELAVDDLSARRYLAFALGKAFDDLEEYDTAFRYFLEGNQIAAAGYPDPGLEALAARFERTKHELGPAFVDQYKGCGIADNLPIFVTGMPRSGTTLAEQILASHPQVHGGGEKGILKRMLMGVSRSLDLVFPEGFNTVDSQVFRKIAQQFIDSIDQGKAHTTNKNLLSYVFIGWIRAFLPNAKIILCRRDPRDIAISSFQLDLGPSYAWSYRLEWIGQYYRAVDDLTRHWLKCFPGQIHVFQYEDMIADPETHIRSLLQHCKLEFDPACLDFHRTARVVTTSSRAQVRKPIYQSSVGRWKNYEKHLEPLFSSL